VAVPKSTFPMAFVDVGGSSSYETRESASLLTKRHVWGLECNIAIHPYIESVSDRDLYRRLHVQVAAGDLRLGCVARMECSPATTMHVISLRNPVQPMEVI
jgi:hypothetical protein